METNGMIQELRELHELQRGHVSLEVVHLDLSRPSLALAEEKTQRCNTSGVTVRFVRGSILDVAQLGLGHFDYIRCTGVLHHMEDPLAGLQALTGLLEPHGLLGVMVYGTLARTGVKEGQRMFRILEESAQGKPRQPLRSPGERLALGRRLVRSLPRYNWLSRNGYMNPAGEEAYDEHFADLLLHPMEHSFTVPELIAWARRAGLQTLEFLPKLQYHYRAFISDPEIRIQLGMLSRFQGYEFVELFLGSMAKHSVLLAKESFEPPPLQGFNAEAVPCVVGNAWAGQDDVSFTMQAFGHPVQILFPKETPGTPSYDAPRKAPGETTTTSAQEAPRRKAMTIRAYGSPEKVPREHKRVAGAVEGALTWITGQIDCERSVGALYRAYLEAVAAPGSNKHAIFAEPPGEKEFISAFATLFGVLESAGMVSLRTAVG